MILVWSSEGGPLQLIGLAIFLLQFILPNIPDPSALLQQGEDYYGIGSTPLLIVLLLFVGGIAAAALVGWMFSDSVDGTADNPVDVDAPPNNNNNNNNNAANNVNPMDHIRSSLQSFSPHYLMLASAFLLPLTMVIPIFINVGSLSGDGFMGIPSGTVAVSILAIAAHGCMAVAAYGILREFLSGNANNFPGNRRRVARKKYTLNEIGEIIKKIPVEEFVSEQDVRNGECSVARMKRILIHRGGREVVEKCLEREELVKEICRVRKYEVECAICSEDYKDGDPLRVLPCQHEYHLHCFDRWMYTFVTDSRAQAEPSCPLCKFKLK